MSSQYSQLLISFDVSISEALCRWMISQSDPADPEFKNHQFLGYRLYQFVLDFGFLFLFFGLHEAQAACVGGLAAMEVLTLKFGRIMPPEACSEYKRAYLIYRSTMNTLASYSLEKTVSIPFATKTTSVEPCVQPCAAQKPAVHGQLPFGRLYLQSKNVWQKNATRCL